MSDEVKAFISYSHDSEAHRDRVLGLAERLRKDGVETILDRYIAQGSPPEGWPRWMLNGLNDATHVLCVCTETYHRRFLGQETGDKGRGGDWEGALVTQALYEARSRSNRFVPVVFSQPDERFIPEPLRLRTHYVIDQESGYQALYDALLGQSGAEPGPVQELNRKRRTTGEPLTFTGASAASAQASANPVLKIWRDKLDFLLVEEAVCVDPAMKFRIQHLIAEAQERVRKFGGEA